MKKVLSIIFFSLLLFTGCFFTSEKQEPPAATETELKTEKKIGIVSTPEELGILEAPSKFVLVVEQMPSEKSVELEKVFIDSVSVNLRRYNKRRVEAEGEWNDSKTIFIIQNISSLGHETQVKEQYQNVGMGLKFSYPSVWSLKDEKNVLGIEKIIITPYEVEDTELNSVDNIIIEKSENNKKLPPREWLKLDEQYRPTDPNDTASVYQQSAVGIAQLDAVKKTFNSGDKIEFYVTRDTFIYRFVYLTVNDADKDLYRNAFYEIVASFEFVPFGTSDAGASKQANQNPAPVVSSAKKETKSLSDLAKDELLERQQEEAAQKKETMLDARQLFTNYIKANMPALAAEPASLGGTWFPTKLEFAFPEGQSENFTAIYVEYEDGHDMRKILLNVKDKTHPETMERAAYFKPGDTTDWILSQGADTAKDKEKLIVPLMSEGAEEVVVKKGMTLLDAKSFKIKIQYPSKWYWAFSDKEYRFSNKPVTAENTIVSLSKEDAMPTKDGLGTMGSIESELNGNKIIEATGGGSHMICIQLKSVYCLGGFKDEAETMSEMLETLTEL